MRPRRLVLQAVGPYADVQALDFDDLPRGALFLVHGPTGAGKSTILDAICYALYGESSGDERGGTELRSHHADSDLPTEVTFDFDVGSERHRIWRTPQQERPKKRGEGFTTQNTDATLFELDAAGREVAVLAKGPRDVNAAVVERLRFEAHQFRQVVVLPQGRFRELLTASSKEREVILEKLFQTEHYRAIEQALRGRARDVERRVRELTEAEQAQAEALAELLGLPAGEPASPTTLQEARERLEAERVLAREAESAARSARDAAVSAADAGGSRMEARRRHLKTAEAHTRAAETLAKTKAEAVAAEERQRRLEGAEAGEARRAASSELHGLESLRVLVAGLETAREEVATHRQASDEAATRLEDATGRHAAAEAAAREAAAAVEQALELAATADSQASEAERRTRDAVDARALVEAQAEKQRMESEVLRTEALRKEREAERASAAEAIRRAHLARDAGRAVVLAQSLEPGMPCPVCGSLEHPRPAHADAAPPTAAEIETLEKAERLAAARVESATAAVQHARAELARTEERVTGLLDGLGERAGTPVAVLEAEAVAATQRAAAAAAAQKRSRLAAAERETARSTVVSLAQSLPALRAQADAARRTWQEAQARYEALLEGIPERFRVAARLEEAIAGARQRVSRLEAELEAARKGARDAGVAHAEARSALEARRQQAAEAEAEAARATEEFDARLRALELPGAETHDPDAFAEFVQGAKDLLAAVQRRVVEIETRLRTSAGPIERIAKLREEREALESGYGTLGRLADVAQGKNLQRLSFQRFVLAALLDEVLAVASVRLGAMSGGRYRIVRRRAPADQRQTAGLDLDVEDGWTGTSRAASTLSGGEGFLAALSLALATADVVQRHAGGIHLDAVFVDEGFGSLDDEALDRAVDSLRRLGDDGRLVGIISHVPELRERIDCRLEVARGRSGSEARFVVP